MNKTITVTMPSLPPFDEYIDEIRSIWDSKRLTNMGDKHKELQAELKEYLGVENVELFTNGHMALELSIQAMGLTGEVITTPFTFASTTHAIVRNGLTPVFCDIDPDDYTIDTSKIEELITDKTSAIVPVHVYGNICNISEIDRLAKKYGLKVIYDAAHAFGETYKGCGVGSFGDISCFSFHATKVFNTIEGGAACFNDPEVGKTLYRLKNFGIEGAESVTGIGANAKLNEFCASMGLCNLRHISEEIDRRKAVFNRYCDRLSDIKGIRINQIPKDVEYNYAYFPVVIDKSVFGRSRDEVFKGLADKGIIARKYFYPIASDYECYRMQYNSDDTPVAKKTADSVITLPIYSELDLKDVDRICDEVISK